MFKYFKLNRGIKFINLMDIPKELLELILEKMQNLLLRVVWIRLFVFLG